MNKRIQQKKTNTTVQRAARKRAATTQVPKPTKRLGNALDRIKDGLPMTLLPTSKLEDSLAMAYHLGRRDERRAQPALHRDVVGPRLREFIDKHLQTWLSRGA